LRARASELAAVELAERVKRDETRTRTMMMRKKKRRKMLDRGRGSGCGPTAEEEKVK
jgi:hypothetical protein